ncbi:unnamed protein product [Lota lota]
MSYTPAPSIVFLATLNNNTNASEGFSQPRYVTVNVASEDLDCDEMYNRLYPSPASFTMAIQRDSSTKLLNQHNPQAVFSPTREALSRRLVRTFGAGAAIKSQWSAAWHHGISHTDRTAERFCSDARVSRWCGGCLSAPDERKRDHRVAFELFQFVDSVSGMRDATLSFPLTDASR